MSKFFLPNNTEKFFCLFEKIFFKFGYCIKKFTKLILYRIVMIGTRKNCRLTQLQSRVSTFTLLWDICHPKHRSFPNIFQQSKEKQCVCFLYLKRSNSYCCSFILCGFPVGVSRIFHYSKVNTTFFVLISLDNKTYTIELTSTKTKTNIPRKYLINQRSVIRHPRHCIPRIPGLYQQPWNLLHNCRVLIVWIFDHMNTIPHECNTSPS